MTPRLTTPETKVTRESHRLLNLHPELQLYIVDRLERFRDLAALTLTCKALHDQLSPVLYRIAYRIEPDLLQWLCSQGGAYKARALRRLLDSGGNPARLQAKVILRADIALHAENTRLDTCHQFEGARNSEKWISRGEVLPHPNKPFNWYRDELGVRHPGQMDHDSSEGLSSVLEDFYDEGRFKVQWSAIHVAAFKNHVQILEVLLKYDSKNGNKLIDSLVTGYCKVEDMLPSRMRERHRLPNNDRHALTERSTERSHTPQSALWTLHSPLRVALCNQHQDAAKLLIERGASLDFAGPKGETEHALHVAARYGCHKIIKLLSTRPGVDLNVADHTGWTPLCEAIVSRQTRDSVSYFIDLGADVNTSLGPDGFTHLHLACYRRQWAHALTLLEAGADVEAIWTPSTTTATTSSTNTTTSATNVDYVAAGTLQTTPRRAIDLICTDTFDPSTRYFDIPNESTNAPLRLNLLTRLISTYKASTSPCPGTNTSPLAIAATRSRESLDLVTAFVKAEVYFHNDVTTIPLVLSSRAEDLYLGEEYTEGQVIALARYLVRNGARVGGGGVDRGGVDRDSESGSESAEENENVVLARAIHRLLTFIRGPKREGMITKFAQVSGTVGLACGDECGYTGDDERWGKRR